MYISKLALVNYRNFANATFFFRNGVNTIIGENGSGKSNALRAIRLLLDDNMVRQAYKLDESDFHRGIGPWQGHWIIISIEFSEVSQDEAIQALFLHGTGIGDEGAIGSATYNLIFRPKKQIRLLLSELADLDINGMQAILEPLTINDYETIFTGRSQADFSDPDVYRRIVGDFHSARFNKELDFLEDIGCRIPGLLSVAKEVSFTFIQALRDVVSEFHNNRTNPLLTLLKSKGGDIDPLLLQPIVDQVRSLNESIEALDGVQTVRGDIRDTIHGAAGQTYSPSSLSIRSGLSEEAEKLFQSLQLFVGESNESHEGPIQELSLGGANLIFLTLKLLEFKYQHEKMAIANFLLIEEPEAHLHTHVQKTLFDRIGYARAQIIYSTHSTHISEVSNVQNVNILGRVGTACEVYQPSAGLSPEEIGNVQRYLDAVRSNLLFAKSVLLVEGDAEAIIIPLMVKKVLGVSLDELGISLVNIGSTGFSNVAVLFHDFRIRRRCSIITDLDLAFIDLLLSAEDDAKTLKLKSKLLRAQTIGAKRKAVLDGLAEENKWLRPFYASNTFEIDLVTSGNIEKVILSVEDVYDQPAKRAQSIAELRSGDITQYGKRVLAMAEYEGKGWFAILLGKHLDSRTVIPSYIRKAVIFAHGEFSTELMFHILKYRLNVNCPSGAPIPPAAHAYWESLKDYRNGNLSFEDIKAETLVTFPSDEINSFLSDVP